jgi:hypothetical protein
MKWKFIFKTYFCTELDAPRRHCIWSKSWWRVPSPCTQLWTNKTQHEEIFSVLHQLTASLFRTLHRLINMEAQQHWTHFYNFTINYTGHQCRSTVMKVQTVMQLKLQALLFFSLNEDMHSASSYKETAHSNNEWAPDSYNRVMTLSPIMAITPTYCYYKLMPFHLIEDNLKYCQ